MKNFWIFFAPFALIAIVLAIVMRPIGGSTPSSRSQGNWRRWLGEQKDVIQAGILVFVGAYTVLTYCLLINSNNALELSRREFDASQRPWVSLAEQPTMTSELDLVPAPGFPKVATFDDVSIGLDITVKNSGHSPARRIGVVVNLYDENQTNVLADQEALCAEFKKPHSPGDTIFETTLFPDDKYTFQRVASFSSVSKLREMDKDKRPIFYAAVVGCIDYQFMFDDTHHQTGFIFDLGRKIPAQINRADFWTKFWVNLDDAPFQPSDLTFIFDEMGTGVAN